MADQSPKPASAKSLALEQAYLLPRVSTFVPKEGRLYLDRDAPALVRFVPSGKQDGRLVPVTKPVIEAMDEEF